MLGADGRPEQVVQRPVLGREPPAVGGLREGAEAVRRRRPPRPRRRCGGAPPAASPSSIAACCSTKASVPAAPGITPPLSTKQRLCGRSSTGSSAHSAACARTMATPDACTAEDHGAPRWAPITTQCSLEPGSTPMTLLVCVGSMVASTRSVASTGPSAASSSMRSASAGVIQIPGIERETPSKGRYRSRVAHPSAPSAPMKATASRSSAGSITSLMSWPIGSTSVEWSNVPSGSNQSLAVSRSELLVEAVRSMRCKAIAPRRSCSPGPAMRAVRPDVRRLPGTGKPSTTNGAPRWGRTSSVAAPGRQRVVSTGSAVTSSRPRARSSRRSQASVQASAGSPGRRTPSATSASIHAAIRSAVGVWFEQGQVRIEPPTAALDHQVVPAGGVGVPIGAIGPAQADPHLASCSERWSEPPDRPVRNHPGPPCLGTYHPGHGQGFPAESNNVNTRLRDNSPPVSGI